MPDEPESKFVMWLTYSCDGKGVKDQSLFDLEKGITIKTNVIIILMFYPFTTFSKFRQDIIMVSVKPETKHF